MFVKNMDNPIVTGMKEGYQYFSAWLDEQTSQGTFKQAQALKSIIMIEILPIGYSVTVKSGKKFISWQTWDLLKLMYYGFIQFCTNFTERHPGYTIYP